MFNLTSQQQQPDGDYQIVLRSFRHDLNPFSLLVAGVSDERSDRDDYAASSISREESDCHESCADGGKHCRRGNEAQQAKDEE